MIHERPTLSPRVRQAVQDYTALNTITSAVEALRAGTASPPALDMVASMEGADEWVRVPLDCPLGRRMTALGLLRAGRGTRGVVRR